MRDRNLLGPWVRRFLLEYLVAERNLARNTQVSYRDTLTLLLPFVGRRASTAIDRLSVEDLSNMSAAAASSPATSGSAPSTRWHASLEHDRPNIWRGARRSAPSRSRRLPRPSSATSRSRKWKRCCVPLTRVRTSVRGTMGCYSSCTTAALVPTRLPPSVWAICSSGRLPPCASWARGTSGGCARCGPSR